MSIKKSVGERVFDVFNYLFLTLFALCTFLPFVYVVAASFATEAQVSTGELFLIPDEFSLDAYRYIFANNSILRALSVSVYVTVVGTIVNLLFTTTFAYSLSRRDLIGREIILNGIIFTMMFSGGMIPTYILVKNLGLLNSLWSLILPGAISAFNLIVVKNFFQELPGELMESARIDGCSDLGVFFKIVLPLSLPVLATFGLFYAVGHWNAYFSALLYINDSTKWPLQVLLRQLIMLSQGSIGDESQLDPTFVKPPEQTVKMAIIVVGTVPILMVYPFLQKHFTKGVLVGALKG